MKRKTMLILLILVISLYSMQNLSMRSHSLATPKQPDMTKEFSPATDYEVSDQSITSFSETMPSDVLYYPDGVLLDSDSSPVFGGSTLTEGSDDITGNFFYAESAGTDDYDGALETGITVTNQYGSVNFHLALTVTDYHVTTEDIYLNVSLFSGVASGTEDIVYNQEVTGTGSIDIYEATSLTTIESFVIWVIFDGGTGAGYLNLTMDSYFVECMPLVDSDHYGESFADVSDWTVSVGNAISSDGDVIQLEPDADGAYDKIYTNTPSLTNDLSYYYEFRATANVTSSTYVTIYGYESDGASTAAHLLEAYAVTTSYITRKGIIAHDGALESIAVLFKSSVASLITIDYLRISPADSMGWQHDGSTTEGITSVDSFSSDGDTITLTNTIGGVQSWDFDIDTTTTQAKIDLTYYQFLELSITNINDGSSDGYCWLLRAYEDSGTFENIKDYSIEAGTFRFNIAALGLDDIYRFRFYLHDELDSITLNFTKAYSIANWTVTKGSATATTDYLFVDSGELNIICPTVTNHYFILDRDPAMSVDTTIFDLFTIDATINTQWFAEYVSGWQAWKVDTLSGTLVSGTMTDIKLLLDGSTIISAITFQYQLPEWQPVASIVVYIHVPFDYWAFNMFLIFLGISLVIVMSCFAAIKIRDHDFNKDKGMMILFVWFLGWAMFLGGALLG